MGRRASGDSKGSTLRLGAELLVVALVTACLGGSLIVVVATYRRQARLRTPPAVVNQPVVPAPVIPEPIPIKVPEPPSVPVEDPTPKALASLAALENEQKQAAEELDRRARAAEEARAAAKSRAARWRRRESLARKQVEAMDDKAHRLEAEAEALAFERDALIQEREATRADLERAKLRAGAPNSFALLPYKGANGTWRQPIAIDCKDGEATLLPDGPTYSSLDLSDRLGLRSSPLVAAVAMAMVKAQRQPSPDGAPVVPYVLFIIRPDGIRSYYEARGQLERIGIAFGYELADPNWEIEIVDDDPSSSFTARNERRGPSTDLQRPGLTGSDPTNRNIWRERPLGDRGLGRGGPLASGGRFTDTPSGAGLGGFGVPDSYVLAEPPASLEDGQGSSKGRSELPNLEPTPPFQTNSGAGAAPTTPNSGSSAEGAGIAGSSFGNPGAGSNRPDQTEDSGASDSGGGFGSHSTFAPGLGDRKSGSVEGLPSPLPGDSKVQEGVPNQGTSGSDELLSLEPFTNRSPRTGNRPDADASLAPFVTGGLAGEGPSKGTGVPNLGQGGGFSSRRGAGGGGSPGRAPMGPVVLGSPSSPPPAGLSGEAVGRPHGLPGGSASGGGGGGGSGDGAGQGASLPSGSYISPRPDLALELVVACGRHGLTIHPGGYQLSTAALEEKDGRLVRTLRAIVSARQRAEPTMTVRPEVRFLVEAGGQSTYWTAREQTILAGLGWPVSLKVAESEPLRVFSGETR